MNGIDGAPPGDRVNLRYGSEELPVSLKGLCRVKMFLPDQCPASDLGSLLRASLRNPTDSASLAEMARGCGKVVISIPDRTRPRIAVGLLPIVLDELAQAGVGLDRTTIFVASGTHSEHSEADLRELISPDLFDEVSIDQNRSEEISDFRHLGVTSRGTPVMINRTLVETDLNVVLGTVAFHYFAGMGGGRKMILPGASSAETVQVNHRLTITEEGGLNPMCRSGRLEGNPVHEDMVEGARFLENVFMVNAVLDGWGGITSIRSGHLVASHSRASKEARDRLEVHVGEPCDLAIASAGGHPCDLDLIQSHKAIDHVAHCVRDGGVIIIAARCSRGVGSESFLPWFDIGGMAAVCRKLRAHYELNGQTALSLMKKLERLCIILVSSLDRDTVERTGMIYADNLQEALASAQAVVGGDPLTYVFPHAWGILPVV